MQLVGGNVNLYYPNGKKSVLYNKDKVRGKYGVDPKMIPDYKSLVGDSADNIRGVAGIGKKTAMNIIGKFGKIENILLELDNINPENLRMKLQNNRELILKNLSLIKLETEIGGCFIMEDFQITEDSWKKQTMEILKDIKII